VVTPLSNLAPSYAVVPGLQRAEREIFDPLRPSEQGICAVDSVMQVTLPVPAWGVFCWVEAYTVSYTAAQGAQFTMLTVPPNERWWVFNGLVEIATGDNNVVGLYYTNADPYSGTSGAQIDLLVLASATSRIIWPDLAGRQTVNTWTDVVPQMLEPGTIMVVSTNGSGASAGTIDLTLTIHKTRMAHTLEPLES